jgi:hypothetical protein
MLLKMFLGTIFLGLVILETSRSSSVLGDVYRVDVSTPISLVDMDIGASLVVADLGTTGSSGAGTGAVAARLAVLFELLLGGGGGVGSSGAGAGIVIFGPNAEGSKCGANFLRRSSNPICSVCIERVRCLMGLV